MNSNSEKTQLDQKFAFWYRLSGEQLEKKEYESNINKIAEFETVKNKKLIKIKFQIEDFWAIFQYLKKPDNCRPGIEFTLVKKN